MIWIRALTFLTCATVFLTSGQSADRKSYFVPGIEEDKFFNIGVKFTKNLNQLMASKFADVNVVYSPMSMLNILGLIYTGSDGQAHDEIGMALCLPRNITVTSNHFANLMKTRRTPKIELHMANKLYFNRGLQIRVDFRKNAQQYFDAEVERLTFAKVEPTAKIINQWVARKTNNKINNIVSPESLDADTTAMVVNAIYFKAKWESLFFPVMNECIDFKINKFEKMRVQVMFRATFFNYTDRSLDLGARILQMPFADSDVSMLIMLPTDIDGLADVEKRLNNIDLRQLPKEMKIMDVGVYLPRIDVEFALDMTEILQELDIKAVFHHDQALGNIFGKQLDTHSSKISAMKHKAFLKVTEGGAEAAAIQIMDKSLESLEGSEEEPDVIFKVDHPFMFAIVSPKEVFFVGHFLRPNPTPKKC